MGGIARRFYYSRSTRSGGSRLVAALSGFAFKRIGALLLMAGKPDVRNPGRRTSSIDLSRQAVCDLDSLMLCEDLVRIPL